MRTDGSDGGPAYPNSVQPDFQYAEPGMSLRDWFASVSLQGLRANPSAWEEMTAEEMADTAWADADRMLRRRAD